MSHNGSIPCPCSICAYWRIATPSFIEAKAINDCLLALCFDVDQIWQMYDLAKIV